MPKSIISVPLLLLLLLIISGVEPSPTPTPTPTPWPHQFHSILFMNKSGAHQLIDLWYDWPNGRNFNIIQDQLGKLLYDLEWNNGTSFFYTLDSSQECKSSQLEVGILPPNWLDGANYLGQQHVDGFLCNVWEKVDFIWYYEDVVTKRPVHWLFYTDLAGDGRVVTSLMPRSYNWLNLPSFTICRLDALNEASSLILGNYSGRAAHVMTFEVGAVLEDAKWQAPGYCFKKKREETTSPKQVEKDYAADVLSGISLERGKMASI